MTRKISLKEYLILTVILLIVAFVINANSVIFGSIKGKLTDRNTGLPIVSAQITVIGTDIKTSTDVNGEFNIKGLDTGLYDLKIEHKKCGVAVLKAVSVRISMVTNVLHQVEFQKIVEIDTSKVDENKSEKPKRQGKKIKKPIYTLTKDKNNQ